MRQDFPAATEFLCLGLRSAGLATSASGPTISRLVLTQLSLQGLAHCAYHRSRHDPLLLVVDQLANAPSIHLGDRRADRVGLLVRIEDHPPLDVAGRPTGGLDQRPTAAQKALLVGVQDRDQGNLGKVAQPIRVAVSGGPVSPPIYDTLVILGRDASLRRMERCLAARDSLCPAG